MWLNTDCLVYCLSYGICIGRQEDRKFIRKLRIQCLVLDEAHMLKNMSTQRYAYLVKIKVTDCTSCPHWLVYHLLILCKAERRLLLTGTPVQNNLLELVSLLSFVMPNVFSNFLAQLKKTFSRVHPLSPLSPSPLTPSPLSLFLPHPLHPHIPLSVSYRKLMSLAITIKSK